MRNEQIYLPHVQKSLQTHRKNVFRILEIFDKIIYINLIRLSGFSRSSQYQIHKILIHSV